MASLRPRLCFVGPFAGSRPGYAITQGLPLSRHLQAAGYTTLAVSASTNRYVRLLDIASTLVRRRRDIDLLVMDVYGGASFVVEDVASLIGRCAGHGIVMLMHGGAMPDFMASFPRWTHRVLSRADALVAPSPFLARAVAPYGFACRVVPNLIEIARYPFRGRRPLSPRLFWMRSFHPVYNPLMAVQVLESLRSTHPDATLVMGGQDKGLQAEVQRYSRERGLETAVRFPGFLDMPAKIREGSAADIFMNTNRIDNMPVAILEACALGLPVVSTDVGGIPDLVRDGETALLSSDGDVEGMVRSIRRLLADPGLVDRLTVAGRRLAEHSAWGEVRPLWEDVFARVESARARRKRGDDVRH